MSTEFHKFSAAVKKQFELMSKGELFVVNIDGDALYEAYQAAFPAGTNEVFRKFREHECSTCKNFIRNIGNVVAIKDGKLVTVWGDDTAVSLPAPYNRVAEAMNKLVREASIKTVFRAEMPNYGLEKGRDREDPKIIWNHFHTGPIASKFFVGKKVGEEQGKATADVQVFRRGMTEITRDAVETVHGLMTTEGALYRGNEFAFAFGEFVGLQSRFNSLKSEEDKNLFIWENREAKGARLRNTAFGTLLVNLSEGMDLEAAVKQWETIMAPTNYKRPTALITPRMVADSMKTINDAGIEPSLHRRLANATDLSVNNVLYVDNALRGKMRGGVASLLAEAAVASTPSTAKATDVGIDQFMATILPKATSMEVLVSNAHQANFMTLTAPVYPDSPNLFKWGNAFGWSYDGNITDSIKERVKAAGGATEGAMRISLAWFNYDDLDLHIIEQGKPNRQGRAATSYEIYFGNRGHRSPMGGKLDVDMNAGSGKTREAVENVVYDRMSDGVYRVVVNNYVKRETSDPGFTLELAVAGGQTMHYSAKTSPASGKDNNALVIYVENGAITKIETGPGIEGRAFSMEKWGVKTEQFTKVDSLLLSPNHWDGQQVGNKHYFFILDACKTDVPARGIYNEFLKPDYEKHRKVFEVLGNKMMCDPVSDQLSGVGFSSTRGDKVVIKVNNQLYNVQF